MNQVNKIANEILKESVEKLVSAELKLTFETQSLKDFQEIVRQVPGFGDFGQGTPILTFSVLINPKITNDRKFRDDLAKKDLKTTRLEVVRS